MLNRIRQRENKVEKYTSRKKWKKRKNDHKIFICFIVKNCLYTIDSRNFWLYRKIQRICCFVYCEVGNVCVVLFRLMEIHCFNVSLAVSLLRKHAVNCQLFQIYKNMCVWVDCVVWTDWRATTINSNIDREQSGYLLGTGTQHETTNNNKDEGEHSRYGKAGLV